MAHFDSALIESIAIVFMLAGGVNFGVHYYAWRNLSLHPYLGDAEVRTYLQIFAGATVFVAISLIGTGTHPDLASSFRFAAFQVGSVLTSTGFTTENFALWPLHLPFVLLLLSFTGGCAGSTAGGIKVLRVLILGKLAVRQLLKLVHPRAVVLVKIDDTLVSSEIMNSVLGFWALYLVTSLLLVLGNLAAGLDLESSLGAVMATINLLGPGLGEVAVDFAGTNDIVKWLGTLGMLAGRLEIFTLLVLFLPAYWRN
jgi:trk system potassium uptake protein TrkH